MESPTSAELLTTEAKSRGISVTTLDPAQPGFREFAYKERREFLYYTESKLLGSVFRRICNQKSVTALLLEREGFPVPKTIITRKHQEIKDFLQKHKVICIKPIDGQWGKGVTPALSRADDLESAVFYAQEHNAETEERRVICQQHVRGDEYRITVVHYKDIFCLKKERACVTGDGVSTAEKLIDAWNAKLVSSQSIDKRSSSVRAILKSQGMAMSSVPEKGKAVYVSILTNMHAGGLAIDATDEIGAEVREAAIAIARFFQVPLLGIDVITQNIQNSLGKVIELNAVPGIYGHHYPTFGQPRNVAAAVIDMLFPETVI